MNALPAAFKSVIHSRGKLRLHQYWSVFLLKRNLCFPSTLSLCCFQRHTVLYGNNPYSIPPYFRVGIRVRIRITVGDYMDCYHEVNTSFHHRHENAKTIRKRKTPDWQCTVTDHMIIATSHFRKVPFRQQENGIFKKTTQVSVFEKFRFRYPKRRWMWTKDGKIKLRFESKTDYWSVWTLNCFAVEN